MEGAGSTLLARVQDWPAGRRRACARGPPSASPWPVHRPLRESHQRADSRSRPLACCPWRGASCCLVLNNISPARPEPVPAGQRLAASLPPGEASAKFGRTHVVFAASRKHPREKGATLFSALFFVLSCLLKIRCAVQTRSGQQEATGLESREAGPGP